MSVAVLGAGAFGTALAIALAREHGNVALWARDPDHARAMHDSRQNATRLPGHLLPDGVRVTADLDQAARAGTLLLAVPMQSLARFVADHRPHLNAKTLVACCKGVDLETGRGPSAVISDTVASATPALLSGPSFAVDIAGGLPTALTLAAPDDATAIRLQAQLATATLRLYRSTDMTGVELGGALKNVVAIACGITIGAGLGESARAALLTRGAAEMIRFALAHGAMPETLSGLAGLGDLVLTCTSEKSRNFAYGLRLGAQGSAAPTATTEGIATARAIAALARARSIDMPITATVAAVLDGAISVPQAIAALMARPLTSE
jgi:glycerol-3-phosphate dehydrogenase (NAD(P)+)